MSKVNNSGTKSKSEFLTSYFQFNIFADTALLFFKSYSEIDNTWSTAKYRRRKSFDTGYYIIILCQFLIKIEINQCFSKCKFWAVVSHDIVFWCKHCGQNKKHLLFFQTLIILIPVCILAPGLGFQFQGLI